MSQPIATRPFAAFSWIKSPPTRFHPIPPATLAPKTVKSRKRTALCRKPVDCRVRGEELARAIRASFELDLARGEALGAHQDLPRDTDQVGRRELRPGPLIEVA